MIEKTKAIVLKNIPFSESSSIVTLLTEDFGLKTYMIRGGRKKNAHIASRMFQILEIVEVVVYNHNKNNSMGQVKECSICYDLQKTRQSIIKTSLTFFLTEIIYLSIKGESPNNQLYSFIESSILSLNELSDKESRDFHLYFLYHFATLLGFRPMDNYSYAKPFFDISKGNFFSISSINSIDTETSKLFHEYLEFISPQYEPFTQNLQQRTELLNIFILFYQEHIINNHSIKSLSILKAIL